MANKTKSQSRVIVTFAYELSSGLDYRVYFSDETPVKVLRDLERNGILILQTTLDEPACTAVPMSVVEQVTVEKIR